MAPQTPVWFNPRGPKRLRKTIRVQILAPKRKSLKNWKNPYKRGKRRRVNEVKKRGFFQKVNDPKIPLGGPDLGKKDHKRRGLSRGRGYLKKNPFLNYDRYQLKGGKPKIDLRSGINLTRGEEYQRPPNPGGFFEVVVI